MTGSQPSSGDISRRLVALIFGANFFGALIIFLYFSVIDPLPVGGAAVRPLESGDILTFGIAAAVIFAGAFAMLSRLGRPIRDWMELIEAGRPASELPSSVARLVLTWPLISASLVAATGLLVAIFFSLLYEDPGNFVGIAIGGAVTTTIVYFGTDLIWRPQVPIFFPEGNLSAVPAFRLWVRRRLLLAFLLIGGLTPVLLVILSQVRTRALLDAGDPQAVLDNLILVQLFILAAGLITAVLVARAIVGPLQVLQEAMGRGGKERAEYQDRGDHQRRAGIPGRAV